MQLLRPPFSNSAFTDTAEQVPRHQPARQNRREASQGEGERTSGQPPAQDALQDALFDQRLAAFASADAATVEEKLRDFDLPESETREMIRLYVKKSLATSPTSGP